MPKNTNAIATITIGTVVDTNDPQQMGRLRIVCPQWGDQWDSPVEDLPWAIFSTPFGGTTQLGTRGPGIDESSGSIAYGLWAIPKVGAQALVMCIDGNPSARIYMGCVFDQYTPHTLPHGRYMYESHPALPSTSHTPLPIGPVSSSEGEIQPLSKNLLRAFGTTATNEEFKTRGADYTAASISVDHLDMTFSKVADDFEATSGNWTSTQGYSPSRLDPHASTTLTDTNRDSTVYAMVSPGFHALSMDDRQENCRMRLRTTSGHQIIMDDTNERIYISTAEGNNWIEMDQNGNIDVYSSRRVSIHSANDINLKSDQSVRISGNEGVHINGKVINLTSTENINIKSGATLIVNAASEIQIQSGDIGLKSSGTLRLTGNAIHNSAPSILNNGSASSAPSADAAPANAPSRIPQHEPWARSLTKSDTSEEPELSYSDANVNKSERGESIERGIFWRR